MTVQDVIDAMLSAVHCEPLEKTVDTLKTGDPGAEVTGIATTFLATLDVLRRAAGLGANMVITHEPTFYTSQDEVGALPGDGLVALKQRFIEENGIAIWRFHDHWHRHAPDGIVEGVVRQLGWEGHQSEDDPCVFVMPRTTVGALAAEVKRRLGTSSVRVVGDPEMACSVVALRVGAHASSSQIEILRRDGVDVLLAGETREWETVEYARDAAAAGQRKALILAGHCMSEEPGMEYLVEWLRPLVPGVSVTFVPAGDPFWCV